jgi:vacuolar-type H+-ATPase subunit C/Vma6
MSISVGCPEHHIGININLFNCYRRIDLLYAEEFDRDKGVLRYQARRYDVENIKLYIKINTLQNRD